MSTERGAMDDFAVVVLDMGTHTVVPLRGELDIAAEAPLATTVALLRDDERPVVFELEELTFLDASGLRALVDAKAALGERLIVRPGPPQVERVLALTRFDRVLRDGNGSPSAELVRRAGNVAQLRELWRAYRAGGASALTAWLPTAPAGELARLWGEADAGGDGGGDLDRAPVELDTVGDHVLVACATGSGRAGRRLVWTVYVFAGRTFIRAVTFPSEAAAREFARSGGGATEHGAP